MNLLFDFTIDKATKTIHITREFATGLDLVWDAFTKSGKWWTSGWRLSNGGPNERDGL